MEFCFRLREVYLMTFDLEGDPECNPVTFADLCGMWIRLVYVNNKLNDITLLRYSYLKLLTFL